MLKRGGKVIVTGEQVISRLDHFIRVLRKMVGDVLSLTGLRNCENNNRQLFKFGFRDVFPSNLEKGDTHYSLKQVTHIFNQAGFSIKCYSFKHNYQKGREWYYLATKN